MVDLLSCYKTFSSFAAFVKDLNNFVLCLFMSFNKVIFLLERETIRSFCNMAYSFEPIKSTVYNSISSLSYPQKFRIIAGQGD